MKEEERGAGKVIGADLLELIGVNHAREIGSRVFHTSFLAANSIPTNPAAYELLCPGSARYIVRL